MPIPTSAPTRPPTPRPANPAIIGPAAMKGPTPGIAKAPIPARTPSVPPITPPVVTPAAVPSGAFVSLACANSRVLRVSGSNTLPHHLRDGRRQDGLANHEPRSFDVGDPAIV